MINQSGAVRVAVVGGGIAGLAAALALRDRLGPTARITVYEQTGAIGGKLRTGSAAGTTAERGAESFLVRDPDGDGESAAVALARQVGLGDDLVHPAAVPPALWVGGGPRPFPAGTLLGIPADPVQVAEVARVTDRDRNGGRPLLAPGVDVAVGELVRTRLGDEVVDRLVDPMLGGVYAGRADSLSLAATMPALAAACRTEPTLAAAVRAARRPPKPPVFATIRGGLSRLVDAVAAASGAELRTGLPVRELAATGTGWRLVVGSTRDPRPVDADAVVLALPARGASRLLAGVDGSAAAHVGALDYASVALVTLALPPGTPLPANSGFLVPATEGLAVKAVTFLTRKWPHLPAAGPVLVRASVGRYGEIGPLRHDDADLAALVATELGRLLEADLPEPVEPPHVQRWGGALPQYAPGHPGRVAAARATLPGTLRLAGAGYDGVGIPACVRSGQAAAAGVVEALAGDPAHLGD